MDELQMLQFWHWFNVGVAVALGAASVGLGLVLLSAVGAALVWLAANCRGFWSRVWRR